MRGGSESAGGGRRATGRVHAAVCDQLSAMHPGSACHDVRARVVFGPGGEERRIDGLPVRLWIARRSSTLWASPPGTTVRCGTSWSGRWPTHLGEDDGVIVFDPSGFEKSGKQSVGVARQWCGRLGTVSLHGDACRRGDNCQVGVSMAYVSSQGHTLVDVEMSLPHEWTDDVAADEPGGRSEVAPEVSQALATLPGHAGSVRRSASSRLDDGRRRIRQTGRIPQGITESASEQYLLAVPCDTTIRDLDIPAPEPAKTGRRRPASQAAFAAGRCVDRGAFGGRVDADRRAGRREGSAHRGGDRASRVETGQFRATKVTEEVLVVIRYRARDERIVKTDYYLSNAEPPDVAGSRSVASRRPNIGSSSACNGPKAKPAWRTTEVRNWLGWHHHQTLSLIATWFLTVETRRAEKKGAGNHAAPTAPRHRRDPPRTLACDSPPVVAARIQQRLRRNQQARFYHWKRRKADHQKTSNEDESRTVELKQVPLG